MGHVYGVEGGETAELYTEGPSGSLCSPTSQLGIIRQIIDLS